MPIYAKDLVFSLEIGVAYLDGRPAASWLVEPEERWAPASAAEVRNKYANLGSGLTAVVVAEELRSATLGYRIYSKDHIEADRWIRRLATACELSLGIKVRDFWSLIIPVDPRRKPVPKNDVEWAEQWAWRAVPETPRMVVLAARDVAFLRELRRIANSP